MEQQRHPGCCGRRAQQAQQAQQQWAEPCPLPALPAHLADHPLPWAQLLAGCRCRPWGPPAHHPRALRHRGGAGRRRRLAPVRVRRALRWGLPGTRPSVHHRGGSLPGGEGECCGCCRPAPVRPGPQLLGFPSADCGGACAEPAEHPNQPPGLSPSPPTPTHDRHPRSSPALWRGTSWAPSPRTACIARHAPPCVPGRRASARAAPRCCVPGSPPSCPGRWARLERGCVQRGCLATYCRGRVGELATRRCKAMRNG